MNRTSLPVDLYEFSAIVLVHADAPGRELSLQTVERIVVPVPSGANNSPI
jgi:hypothetical protein